MLKTHQIRIRHEGEKGQAVDRLEQLLGGGHFKAFGELSVNRKRFSHIENRADLELHIRMGEPDARNELQAVLEQTDFILDIGVGADRHRIGEIEPARADNRFRSLRQVARRVDPVEIRAGPVAVKPVGDQVTRKVRDFSEG